MTVAQTIKPNLMRAIWATARQTDCSGADLHEAIKARFKKVSMKQLTNREAHMLLDSMKGKPRFEPGRSEAQATHGRKDHDAAHDTVYMVNAADLSVLRKCARARGWDDDALAKFVLRQLDGKTIRTMADLNKVLWPLKSMNRRDHVDMDV